MRRLTVWLVLIVLVTGGVSPALAFGNVPTFLSNTCGLKNPISIQREGNTFSLTLPLEPFTVFHGLDVNTENFHQINKLDRRKLIFRQVSTDGQTFYFIAQRNFLDFKNFGLPLGLGKVFAAVKIKVNDASRFILYYEWQFRGYPFRAGFTAPESLIDALKKVMPKYNQACTLWLDQASLNAFLESQAIDTDPNDGKSPPTLDEATREDVSVIQGENQDLQNGQNEQNNEDEEAVCGKPGLNTKILLWGFCILIDGLRKIETTLLDIIAPGWDTTFSG